MKILFVLASLGCGGAERVVSILANRLIERGFQVEIVCLLYNDYYYEVSEKVKVTFLQDVAAKNRKNEKVSLDASPSNILVYPGTMSLFKRGKWLRRYCSEQKIDGVIAFTEGVYCFVLASLFGTRIKVISSERNDPKFMSWKRNLLKRVLLPTTDWLVVQTEQINRSFNWGGLKSKTSIIVNPVREDVFNEGNRRICTKDNVIVSVARLFEQKRQEILIEAFSLLVGQFPNWKLYIYGEGPRRKELEELILRKKLQNNVFLPGTSDSILLVMQKAKFFCLSSDYEGMSNAMVEAVCLGLPIVSTKVSGTDELIVVGKNGYVVARRDIIGLSVAMKQLMDDDEKVKSFGEYSFLLSEKFKLEKVIKEWERLITSVFVN